MIKHSAHIRHSAWALLLAGSLAWIGMEESAAGHVNFSVPLTRLQYSSSMPSWEFFEDVIRRDAAFWIQDRYYNGTLSRVDLVEGSVSSGYWSAKATYEYVSGWDNKSYYGWVIFRFRNGRLDCLVYHNFQRTCRAPNG